MGTVNATMNLGKALVGMVEGELEAGANFAQGLVEDYGKAGDKLAEGDALGAAVEMMDAGSLGNTVARALSSRGITPDDEVTRNLIAGVLNAATLNPIALKDMLDIGQAVGETKGKGAPSHSCPSPRDYIKKRGLPKRGFPVLRDGDGIEARLERIENLLKKLVADGNVKTPMNGFGEQIRGWGEPQSEVAKLGPNATFEDLVAAFMIDVMKQQQRDVKEMMAKLEQMNQKKKMAKKFDQAMGGIKQLGGLIGAAWGPAGGVVASQVTGMVDNLGKEAIGHDEDSRQLLFERLKNLMQKIQQMFQSLSNVLNVMHQGAMNSIRNIK